ncbi:MAG TPA: helix-turn-helix domain-containing protein [Terriglobales bacterium]|nr:helix-turn-helix domain-containing protein [Terriglobales bacterium]
MNERSLHLQHLEKIAHSQVLHGSESLCRLLHYLGEHALNHPGEHLKEYQIATEIFGRPADFNPQSDSTVRVQVGRLRSKLAEYYNAEGAEDPILVDLPKGSYVVSFHHREPISKTGDSQVRARTAAVKPIKSERNRPWQFIALVLGILLIASFSLITVLQRRSQSVMSAFPSSQASAIYSKFWSAFVSSPEEPWVIFSNGAFVGRPETGMRYFDPARDSRNVILDHYTGVGEVLAMHALDQVFDSLHHIIRVKRGSLFSLDDAQNDNLIFIGSPAENLTLRDLPSTQEFMFQRLTSGPRKGDLAIINVHPQPKEPAVFLGTPSTLPLDEDYAIIGFVPGLNPARSIMILAGTTTLGTEAAVEYVCRENSLRDLLARLGVSKNNELKPFEAVLHVTVKRGVPVQEGLVAVRPHSR